MYKKNLNIKRLELNLYQGYKRKRFYIKDFKVNLIYLRFEKYK